MKIGITAVGDKEDLTEKYDRFIHPLYAVSNSVHEGELPLSENLLNVTGNVKVDVLKKAENGDGIIIRLYNLEKRTFRNHSERGQNFCQKRRVYRYS